MPSALSSAITHRHSCGPITSTVVVLLMLSALSSVAAVPRQESFGNTNIVVNDSVIVTAGL